jgi:hypothetical protein
MIRSKCWIVVAVLPSLLFAAAALAEPPSDKLQAACESRAPEFGDKRDVSCPFVASGKEQSLRFRVNFVGSHDDTELAMKPVLNQRPLACVEGSKLTSRFEDGEISLECRFSLRAKAGSKQVLDVAIEWTHAQYTGFEFVAE